MRWTWLIAVVALLTGCPQKDEPRASSASSITVQPFDALEVGDEWVYDVVSERTVELGDRRSEPTRRVQTLRRRISARIARPGRIPGTPEWGASVSELVEEEGQPSTEEIRSVMVGKQLVWDDQVVAQTQAQSHWEVGPWLRDGVRYRVQGEHVGRGNHETLIGTFENAHQIHYEGRGGGEIVLDGRPHPIVSARLEETRFYDTHWTLIDSESTERMTIELRDGRQAKLVQTRTLRLKSAYLK